MDPLQDIETVDSGVFQTDWRKQVNFAKSYDGYKQEIIKMLQESEHMCN